MMDKYWREIQAAYMRVVIRFLLILIVHTVSSQETVQECTAIHNEIADALDGYYKDYIENTDQNFNGGGGS